jgi:DNA modification methylase
VDPGHWFFKLFNSIKEAHEVDFAELELFSLLGPVERIRNFADVLHNTPLKHFVSDPVRIQDVLSYEPCYGYFQGFMARPNATPDIERLVRRLAYTREIVGVLEDSDPGQFLKKHLPNRESGIGVASYQSDGFTLIRLITNQYYLEKSAYVSKLSRNEEEIQGNVKTLLEYPFRQFYRIPASATMSVGKRLEDYFTVREEGSLYLTHMLHPYKGKFHAKMVRALLNYVMPNHDGHAMDNFAGSGTLLLEAALMALNSTGVEINPLSVLMSRVKSETLTIEPEKLKRGITLFLREVSGALSEYQTVTSGDTLLVQPKFDAREVAKRIARVPETIREVFSSPNLIEKFVIAEHTLEKLPINDHIQAFLLLGLSGTISDLARRTSQDFVDVLSARLSWMYRRVFLFSELNGHLNISPGESKTYVGDTRDMRVCWTLDGKKVPVEDDSIDAIVNSPPYSTALDYVRNDLPQLTILNLAKSLDQLERDMIGNPNLRYYSEDLANEIEKNDAEFQRIPEDGKSAVRKLMQQGRKREALRVYKFFKDIQLVLLEMIRVLKPGGQAAIIIGNNHYKLDGEYMEVKNDEVIAKMAENLGMSRDRKLPLHQTSQESEENLVQIQGGIRRRLEKTMTGMIRYETVLVLEKPRDLKSRSNTVLANRRGRLSH